MTDTASRPDMKPAVATLTMPDDVEDISDQKTEQPSSRSWSWPATAVETEDPVDIAETSRLSTRPRPR